jgi:hypothetical protein
MKGKYILKKSRMDRSPISQSNIFSAWIEILNINRTYLKSKIRISLQIGTDHWYKELIIL